MSFKSVLIYDRLEKMSVDNLESEIEKLMYPVKIMQILIHTLKKPEYNILLSFKNYAWHFNFCKYFSLSDSDYYEKYIRYNKNCFSNDFLKCNCMNIIISIKDIEQWFDKLKNVFDGFNMLVLCEHFKFLDISKQDFQQIDSIKELLVNYKNDKSFLELYEDSLRPSIYWNAWHEFLFGSVDCLEEEEIYTQVSKTLPILEKLKVKKHLFNFLVKKWMRHKYFFVNEQIQFFPHLLTLYNKYIDEYCSKFLKVKDLVEILDNLINESTTITTTTITTLDSYPQQIELEFKSLYDDKGQVLNSDDFEKSLRKFNGSINIILNEIVEIFGLQQQQMKDPVCYIVALRIDDEKNSMHKIPLHKYQSFKDLIGDKSKIEECRKRAKDIDESLFFENEKRGYHFSFCPNELTANSYRFCNCLKETCDDDKKMLDGLKKYAEKFDISTLNEYFEYFNFTFTSEIEVLDEIFHDEEFNVLHENLLRRINPKYDVQPTIMPLLEKLKVCKGTFKKLFKGWQKRGHSLYNILGNRNENKYPHCINLYKSLFDESTRCMMNSDLIELLDEFEIDSKIYLETYNPLNGLLQKLEGNKIQVINKFLNYNHEEDFIQIKILKVDDDDEIFYFSASLWDFLSYYEVMEP